MRAALAALLAALTLAATARAETVTVTCGSLGVEYRLCREAAEAWAAETGHRVELVQGAGGTTDRLALFQQLLAAESPDIDGGAL